MTVAQQQESLDPHVQFDSENLVPDAAVTDAALWSLHGGAVFDGMTSRTSDGSGSLKLATPIPNGSMVFSRDIPIEGGHTYTVGFFAKSENGPTFGGMQLCLHNRNKEFVRNLTAARGATSIDGEWQEFAMPVFVPEDAAFVRVQAYKSENTQPGGQIWVDDFSLRRGVGLRQPPTAKREFEGQHVRVDGLGNFEILTVDKWTPFFPLCMYSDNARDWSMYSRQGWNTIIWTGAAHQVQQAKDAVSDFNPNGMMAGFQISQYTFPSGWAYNDLNDLNSKLREIFDAGLADRLLLYYWDNENNHDQWQVPSDVIHAIHKLDVDASGKRLHPVYALQGEYNAARAHAARGLVDVSGMYVDGAADRLGHPDTAPLKILDQLEYQVSPAAFAQFNGVVGAGDMRLRLYNSLIVGAKAIGFWRDCFPPTCTPITDFDGPVEHQKWWPDIPNLRRELDQLLPVIREPHWTDWTATVNNPLQVHIGTRQHDGHGFLFLVNQTSQSVQVTVTLKGLSTVDDETKVQNLFDGQPVAMIQNGSFTMTLPGLNINSGTAVLKLE